MKNEYYEVYEILYHEFHSDIEYKTGVINIDEYYLVKIIKNSINKNDFNKLLRPDAKYFLVINFYYLIIKPLDKKNKNGFEIYDEVNFELEERIVSDIDVIISTASKDTKDKEISGHQIMRTIDKLWRELKTTRIEIWG